MACEILYVPQPNESKNFRRRVSVQRIEEQERKRAARERREARRERERAKS